MPIAGSSSEIVDRRGDNLAHIEGEKVVFPSDLAEAIVWNLNIIPDLLDSRYRLLEEVNMLRGVSCAEERKAGNGGCGLCALCAKEARDERDDARLKLAEVTRERDALRIQLEGLKK